MVHFVYTTVLVKLFTTLTTNVWNRVIPISGRHWLPHHLEKNSYFLWAFPYVLVVQKYFVYISIVSSLQMVAIFVFSHTPFLHSQTFMVF